MKAELKRLEDELNSARNSALKPEQIQKIVEQLFSGFRDIASVESMTNAQLKRVIEKIEVAADGSLAVYLRPLNEAYHPNCSSF